MPIHIERARLHFGVGDDTEQSAGLEEFLLTLTEHCQVSRRNSIAEIHRAGKIMEKDINDSFEAQGQAVMGESQKSLSSVGLLSSLVVRLEYGQFLREVPPAPRLRPADWTYKHQVGVQTSPRQRSSEQSEYSEEEEEEERQDHSREPFSPPRHQETSSSSWLRPAPAAPAAPAAPRPPAPPSEAAQAASSPKMLPAPVPANQMPEIVRSIDRPLPSVRSRVQQLEEATAATTRDVQDRRPLRPPPGGLGRSSFGQVKVPTPRHGPHMQEVVAPPPPKAPSRKASPAPRPQIQAHFVDYQDSHEAPSRRMSPAGSSEPLLPLSPPWQAASSEDTNQAPQLPHLLCRPGRMALTELASEEAKPDSPERCRKQESHSGSEADSCRRGRRSAVECGSDRKVSPGRSDTSVDMAALEVPGSPQGGSSSRGSLQDRINQQMDKELSSHSPSEAGDAEALEAAPETQVDDLPFADLALGQKAEDIPSDAAVADFLLQMHEQTGKGQTSRSSSEANDLSAYAAQAEQGLEDGKPEEVHEEIEKETSRSSSEAEEPEQQEAETEEQADDIPLDSAQADQAVEKMEPEEVHEKIERETSRSSSEAEEPEQQEVETEEQADDLPLDSAQADQAGEEIKPEEVHEQIERETSRSSSEAEEPEQQEAETEEQAKADLPLDSAAEQSSEEIEREEAAEMQESALAASGSEADEPEQQEREVEKQAQDVPLDTVPAPALEASKAEDPTPAAQERPQETPQVPPASSFSSFKLNACAVAFVPGAMTWTGLNAEAPQEIQQPKDAKQITEETWENYICDQKQKENLAAQATSHTEATADEETADTLSAPLEAEPLPADAVPEQALEERQPEEMDEKMDENSIRGSSEADEPEQQEAETDRQAEPLPADAVAEQALEERKPEEVDEKMDENSIRGISEADEPEQQEAETDHQAAPLPADAVAEQALEERKPEEMNENMDENSIRGSSEADEPEQQEAETDHQAKPLPADAVREEALEERKPEEIDERMDENSNRSSSEAGDLPSDAVLAEQELEGSKPEEAVAERAPISSAFEAQREEKETPAADTAPAPQALEALGAETARLRDEENVLSEYTGSEGELSKATSSCEMHDTSLGEIAEKAEDSIEPAKQKAEESEEPAKEQAESREAEKAIENGTATEKAQEMEDAPDGPPEAMDSLDSGAIEKEMEDAPEREIDDKGTPSRSEEVAGFDTIGGAWRGESLSPQHRTSSRVWHLMRLQPLPPADPEDNWEMSSCENGEMDEEEHELMLEKLRVDKKVPRWCENYLELVHQQHDWDPDSIFGQVPTCDLEEVLPDSIYEELGEKRSYLSKRRKSEGDWSRDRLTDDNVEDYKMKLGHTKAWIADVDALSPTQRAMIEGFGGVSRSRGSRDTAASPRNNASDIQ